MMAIPMAATATGASVRRVSVPAERARRTTLPATRRVWAWRGELGDQCGRNEEHGGRGYNPDQKPAVSKPGHPSRRKEEKQAFQRGEEDPGARASDAVEDAVTRLAEHRQRPES